MGVQQVRHAVRLRAFPIETSARLSRLMIRFETFVQCLIRTVSMVALSFSIALADEPDERFIKWGKTYEDDILPIIRSRCLECHSGDQADGEFDLAKYADGSSAVAAGDAWDRVARRVRQNEMPPQGSPGLNDSQKSRFHRWVDSRPGEDLCRQIASDETQAWYKGNVMSRRLTASEYANAVEHLVGVPLLPAEVPPSDGAGGEGFDTGGDALFTSAIHLEAYLSAADRVIETAIDNELRQGRPRETASGPRLIGVLPQSIDSSSSLDDRQAALAVIKAFARRAWRRPVADEELQRLIQLFDHSSAQHVPFAVALGQPLKAIIVSPHFLFVVESEPAESGVQRITPHQLATRLSLLIWSSVPDETLLEKADSGQLYDDEVLRGEIERMLADPKARGLGENFGLQWLGLRNFGEVRPDPELFPEYSSDLANDMREEAVALVTAIFRDDAPLTDLVSARYAFVNGRLASHYGIDLPEDASWQKVNLPDGKRGGVITMASVLTLASYPRRTSPVLRGRWLLDELLGARVPPPPPNVPALEESGESSATTLTMRQRLEVHRQNPECASCHDRMDPLGFGLENFDAIGRWRRVDHDLPIDATGRLPSGESFDGPEQLKAILLNRSAEFERHFIRKLLGFALGRELNKFDLCVVDDCIKALKDNGGRSRVLIEKIALSYPFQHRFFK